MTPEEILEVDAKRNHPPGTTVEDLITDINDELREGGDLVQEGNVLIVYRAVEPGVVEFHTFNADTPQNLYGAVRELFLMLKQVGCEIARTTYENEKISDLFSMGRPEFDISITKEDGYFVAEARL
jgi:hypothetical protein